MIWAHWMRVKTKATARLFSIQTQTQTLCVWAESCLKMLASCVCVLSLAGWEAAAAANERARAQRAERIQLLPLGSTLRFRFIIKGRPSKCWLLLQTIALRERENLSSSNNKRRRRQTIRIQQQQQLPLFLPTLLSPKRAHTQLSQLIHCCCCLLCVSLAQSARCSQCACAEREAANSKQKPATKWLKPPLELKENKKVSQLFACLHNCKFSLSLSFCHTVACSQTHTHTQIHH